MKRMRWLAKNSVIFMFTQIRSLRKSTVGASLLAMAVVHLHYFRLEGRYRQQAGSYRGMRWVSQIIY